MPSRVLRFSRTWPRFARQSPAVGRASEDYFEIFLCRNLRDFLQGHFETHAVHLIRDARRSGQSAGRATNSPETERPPAVRQREARARGFRVVLVWQRQSIAATAAGHRLLRHRGHGLACCLSVLETPGHRFRQVLQWAETQSRSLHSGNRAARAHAGPRWPRPGRQLSLLQRAPAT